MKQSRILAILVCTIIIGFYLRIFQLNAVALRGDEAFSALNWAGLPINESLRDIASLEPHPPLTYVLFGWWGQIFGIDSPFALRMFAVFGNLIGIAAIFALGKRLTSVSTVGLLAAFLWSIHPFQIWHAQDFRNYALWASLSILTLYAGLRVIFTHQRTWQAWIKYSAIAIFASLVFYFDLLTIGVLSLFVIVMCWRRWRFIAQWCIVNVLIIAIVVANFLIFQGDLVTSDGYAGTTGTFSITQYVTRFVPVLTFGDTLIPIQIGSMSLQMLVGAALTLGYIIMWAYLWQQNRRTTIFVVLLVIAPMVVLGIVSIVMQIFRPRYIMPSAIGMTLTVSMLLWHMWQKQRLKSFLIATGWVLFSFISIGAYHAHPDNKKAPNWDILGQYLKVNTEEDDLVIQSSIDAGFGYYYALYNPLGDEGGLPESPQQSAEAIHTILEQSRDSYNSLWVVAREERSWQSAGIVDAWMQDNMQLVRSVDFDGLPARQFKTWQVTEPIASNSFVTFDDAALLRDVVQFREPDGRLILWVYWEALKATQTDLKIFVHLAGNINPATGTPVWAQDDQQLHDGLTMTTDWDVGIVYRDVYELDLRGVPTGEYDLLIGYYDPNTGERVFTNENTDSYRIDTIVIE